MKKVTKQKDGKEYISYMLEDKDIFVIQINKLYDFENTHEDKIIHNYSVLVKAKSEDKYYVIENDNLKLVDEEIIKLDNQNAPDDRLLEDKFFIRLTGTQGKILKELKDKGIDLTKLKFNAYKWMSKENGEYIAIGEYKPFEKPIEL